MRLDLTGTLITLLLASTGLPSGAQAGPAYAKNLAILPFEAPEAFRYDIIKLESAARQAIPNVFRSGEVQASSATYSHKSAVQALFKCELHEVDCQRSFSDIASVGHTVRGVLSDDGTVFTLYWSNFMDQEPRLRALATYLSSDVVQRPEDVRALIGCLFKDFCGEITVIVPEPVEFIVDGVPLPGPVLHVPPGSHRIVVKKPGYFPATVLRSVALGEKTSHEPVLVPMDPKALPVVEKKDEEKKPTLWAP